MLATECGTVTILIAYGITRCIWSWRCSAPFCELRGVKGYAHKSETKHELMLQFMMLCTIRCTIAFFQPFEEQVLYK